jgi:argininosuccinate lyase
MEEFSQSVSYDKRLYPQDIRGSIAHARMLGETGIIENAEAEKIIAGLRELEKQLSSGDEPWDITLEDVHMNIESLLRENMGDAASRLHTARSRNDQVATDLALYLRETSEEIQALLVKMMDVILAKARAAKSAMLPGYTHMQRAQPVLLAHHLMAYFEMLRRDHRRFELLTQSVELSPLGSGALAGTPHAIDRDKTAAELGFAGVTRNSMDAVSDRDAAAEFLFAGAMCQLHLSRLAEEIVLWASAEFSFIRLPDAFSTGSSMMPQKKNPDSAELVRGKSGRMVGNLTSLLVTLKGLPMTYNRDLQEDKEPIFDSADTLAGSLMVMTGLMRELEYDLQGMEKAAAESYTNATDLADYLVAKGVPFRDAHEITGQVVRECLSRDCPIEEVGIEELKKFSSVIGKDIYDALALEVTISRRDNPGGTAPDRVAEAMEEADAFLAALRR